MKKVIALALALTLALSMASVAFAAYGDNTLVDTGISGTVLTLGNANPHSGINSDPTNEARLYPGEKYDLELADFITAAGGSFNIEDVTSITVSWKKGGALVSTLKLKNKGKASAYAELEINENYTITDAKDLEGKVTIKYKDTADNNKIKDVEFTLLATVGNELIEEDGYSKKADAKDSAIDALNNTIYKCTDAGYLAFNSDTRLLTTVLKMAKDEKAFMYSNEDMIDEVEEKYGDLDAEINCYQFGGRPTFRNAAEFSLQADYADQYYVYEWDGKKLTKQDYKWNSIDGVYEWSTKSPKAYVISDKELVAADEDEEDAPDDSKNPDTGANDVVGVAAALAVVSLVAAGAVSLKK